MNSIKRRITLAVLILGGVGCIVAAIVVPPVAPVLGSLGGVLLAGAFGMFQAVITPSHDNDVQKLERPEGEPIKITSYHVDHNISLDHSSVNILFLYNRRPMEGEPLADPLEIIRPHRPEPLMLI